MYTIHLTDHNSGDNEAMRADHEVNSPENQSKISYMTIKINAFRSIQYGFKKLLQNF